MTKRRTDSHQCLAPGCRAGYSYGPKASLFAALKNDDLRNKCERNLYRKGKAFVISSAVCEHHFEPFCGSIVPIISGNEVRIPLGICTSLPFMTINKSAYCALSKNNCDDNYQPRPDRLSALGHDWEVQAKVAISAGDMFECYMRSTDPTCSAMPCKENIVRTYFRHPGHMCYTLDLIEYAQSESTFLRCKAPWTWG
ncbi:hypothetical protein MRX96_029326 [Rhipicephalus microplus]